MAVADRREVAAEGDTSEKTPPSGTYLGNGLYQRTDGVKKKVEVYIDPALDKRLRMEAAERDSSKAEVITALIRQHYGEE